MTPEALRQQAFRGMVSNYKAMLRYEKQLEQKRFQRVYKNPTCKSAIKQSEDREDILVDKVSAQKSVFMYWMRLPEVRQDKTLQMTGTALRYAAELAKRKPRRKKYLKGQLLLVE